MSSAHGDERFEEIRRAVDDGTYRVDALDVADAILKRWRSIDVVAPDAGAGLLDAPIGDDYSTSIETDSDVSSR